MKLKICLAETIPEVLWNKIIKYCNLNQCLSLRLASRRLNQYVNDSTDLYEQECLKIYMSSYEKFQLFETSISTSESDPVISQDKRARKLRTKWWNLLISGGKIKRLWKISAINSMPSYIKTDDWTVLCKLFLDVLKDPPLPLPRFDREESSVYRKTIFQHHLYEFILNKQEEPILTKNDSPISQILFTLLSALPALLKECQDKNTKRLFHLRWYQNDTSYDDSPYSKSIPQDSLLIFNKTRHLSMLHKNTHFNEENSTITRLITCARDTFTYFCRITKHCFRKFHDPINLLEEYSKRWVAYSAAMIEFDNILSPLAYCINKCYESAFPSFISSPKFSFSRMMNSIWRQKVYSKLSKNLLNLFCEQVSELRKEKLKNKLASKLPSSELPDLFSKATAFDSEDFEDFLDQLESPPPPKDILLFHFTQAIVDISVNDLTIHYLGSTKFIPDDPYAIMHKAIISQTKIYYKDCETKLSVIQYKEIIEEDVELMRKIILPMTLKHIEKIGQKYLEKCIRHFVMKQFNLFQRLHSKKTEFCKENVSSHLLRLIKELASNYPNAIQLSAEFYQYFILNEEMVFRLYELICSKRTMEYRNQTNIEIDYRNGKRNIPFSLSHDEELLYGFSNNIAEKHFQVVDVDSSKLDNVKCTESSRMQFKYFHC